MTAQAPIAQPAFDPRITTLAFPLQGGKYGSLKRGFMIWDQVLPGYSGKAQVDFLYNPSQVTANYSMSDSSVGASLLFPTGFNDTNLRVPLNQSVSWSLLFDRTYELWGGYDSLGLPQGSVGPGQNNPSVVGVLADIRQMQQFTGMNVAYSTGNTATTSPSSNSQLAGYQGIMQLIPSWVYFSDANNLWFHGYVSEWDVTVTHWTQYMVPMRCVIDVTFTMLPPPSTGTGSQANTQYGLPSGSGGQFGSPVPSSGPPSPGVSGR
jgi:hypothetical protein